MADLFEKKWQFKSKYRTGEVHVKEYADYWVSSIEFSKVGEFPDQKKVEKWLRSIYVGEMLPIWGGDGKPLLKRDPKTGERITIFDEGIAIVEPSDG